MTLLLFPLARPLAASPTTQPDPVLAEAPADAEAHIPERPDEKLDIPAVRPLPSYEPEEEENPDSVLFAVRQLFGTLPSWPDQEDLLRWCEKMHGGVGAIFILAGVVYLLFGWQIHQGLIVTNLATVGAIGGWFLGKQADAEFAAAAVGGVTGGAAAWPWLRRMVALTAAVFGFVAGVAVWRCFDLGDSHAAAGGMIGGVFLCMLTFIVYDLSVIILMSLQGATMLLAGILSVLLKFSMIVEPVREMLLDLRAVMPLAVFIVTLIGVFWQKPFLTAEPAKK